MWIVRCTLVTRYFKINCECETFLKLEVIKWWIALTIKPFQVLYNPVANAIWLYEALYLGIICWFFWYCPLDLHYIANVRNNLLPDQYNTLQTSQCTCSRINQPTKKKTISYKYDLCTYMTHHMQLITHTHTQITISK